MGPIGLPEMMALFVIALLLFGPKKLPELGRTLGKGLSEFRRAKDELQATFNSHMREIERETQLEGEAKTYTPIAAASTRYDSEHHYDPEPSYDTDYHSEPAEPQRQLTDEQTRVVEANAATADPAAYGVAPVTDTVARSNGYHSVHASPADREGPTTS